MDASSSTHAPNRPSSSTTSPKSSWGRTSSSSTSRVVRSSSRPTTSCSSSWRMSDSFAAEEKQKAGMPIFIRLVDTALQEAHRMLETVEGDEQVYFAVELVAHFLAAGNAVMSTVEAKNDAVEVTARERKYSVTIGGRVSLLREECGGPRD